MAGIPGRRKSEEISLLSDDEAETLAAERSRRGGVSGRRDGGDVVAETPRRGVRRVVARPPSYHRRNPDEDDLVVVSSSVIPVRRAVIKRPRSVPGHAASGGSGPGERWAETFLKKPAVNAVLPLTASPPASANEPVQPGPKCGICMETMGGSTGRPMASGPCGHVYCKGCLESAVKTQRRCPTCRKSLQIKQIHRVFVQF